MKAYYIYFFLMKILIFIQFILVILKKQTMDSDIYLITDTLLKLSLALYLFLFSFIHASYNIVFEDILILRFAGFIMLFDIDFTTLSKFITKKIPQFNIILKILDSARSLIMNVL